MVLKKLTSANLNIWKRQQWQKFFLDSRRFQTKKASRKPRFSISTKHATIIGGPKAKVDEFAKLLNVSGLVSLHINFFAITIFEWWSTWYLSLYKLVSDRIVSFRAETVSKEQLFKERTTVLLCGHKKWLKDRGTNN